MRTQPSSALSRDPRRAAEPIVIGGPMQWVAQGYRDFRRVPAVGIPYGLMVTVMGWVILSLGNHPYFIAAAITGFLLLGPILGAGLIESSRAMAARGTPTFETSLIGLDRNSAALVRFALVLVALGVAWLTLSALVLSAMLGPIAPTVGQSLWYNALRLMSPEQWFAWAAIGGVLAVLSFSISVIAVPLILDQNASAGDAIRGSLRAVSRHPLTSAGWALTIVLLTAVGFATALIGLIVIYPVLGHASWYAYRALRE